MPNPRLCTLTIAALLLFSQNNCLHGQTNARPPAARSAPTPNDTLKSPEILPDNRVTFRIYAPKASEVSVGGDWVSQGLGTAGKLVKSENGVWSLTVGPLPPDFYSYSFTVDGVRTIDPKNVMVKQGISSLDSMFLLPGKEAAYGENQLVPHGIIREAWYQSTTLGTQRRLHVYTPPGYDQSSEKLPVLYLLHGAGDEDSGWSTVGRAGFILDNLLAGKKANPMLIVMPNGSLPRPENMPVFTRGETPSPEAAVRMAEFQARFTKELMNDIVPFVEKNFRVRKGTQNRAIAGLSMGGGQTTQVFTSHPDQFGYVAIWSAGIGRNADTFEERNAAFLKNAEKINQQTKLVSICVGDKDMALDGSKKLSEMLTKHGIKNELYVSGGGHTWINWRHYLSDLAPRLFVAK